MRHLFKGGVYLTVGRDRFVLTVILLFFYFNYNGAVAPRAMALNGAYYFFCRKRGADSSNKVMLFHLVLTIHDKKTQAMILGHPFQELVLQIANSYFF